MISMRLVGRVLPVVFVAVGVGCSDAPRPGALDSAPIFEPLDDGRIVTDGGASRGVGWADFDQDGDYDLVVANTGGQWNSFYLNTLRGRNDDRRGDSPANTRASTISEGPQFLKASDPDLSFVGSVAASGSRAEGVSWVDYDGDGDLDLHIVTRGQEADLLFNNQGEAGLVRVLDGMLVRPISSTMACWADVDGDGWLDVYLVAYRDTQRNSLLRNRGRGVFEDMSDSPAAFGSGTGRSCGWGDPNDDGLPDLYVGLAREPNRFFWNRGGFVLQRETDTSHLTDHVGYSYGLSWADFDGDGSHDLFVANFDVENVLYRNDGTGRLEPVADDLVANGTYGPDMRNFLYLNDGQGHFARDMNGEFALHADTSAGAAWADIDLDGDLDIFVANWGSSDQVNRLYRNTTSQTTGRSWVTFRLSSTSPNSFGWGAKVRAKARIRGVQRWMTRWNIPTTGYGSQNGLMVHFGLDDATSVDSLFVRWPSGNTDIHTDISARAAWAVIEGAGIVVDQSSSGASR